MEYRVIRSDDELMHYGIKGQKWGIRRYQNKDGSLTEAGRKRAIQEYKSDNKTAYELGKSATVYGHATARSMNRTIKLENKLDKQYAKDPTGSKKRTQSLRKKWDASSKSTLELAQTYNKLKDSAEKHCNSLIKKYGKEAVSNIKYSDKKLAKGEYSPKSFKTMDEKTNNATDWAIAGAMSLGTTMVARLMGSPFTMIYTPSSTGQKAYKMEKETYRRNRTEQKYS